MWLKKFLVLTKILSAFLLWPALAWSSDHINPYEEQQKCYSEFLRLQIERDNKPKSVDVVFQNDGTPKKPLKLLEPLQFRTIDDKVKYLTENPEFREAKIKDLEIRLLNGTFQYSDFMAVTLLGDSRAQKNWMGYKDKNLKKIKGLEAKGGIKVVQSKKLSLIERKLLSRFSIFDFIQGRAYADRALFGVGSRFNIILPEYFVDNTADPTLALAKFGLSYTDALEYANNASQNVIWAIVQTFFRGLTSTSMVGYDIFKNTVNVALKPFGKGSDDIESIIPNFKARFFLDKSVLKDIALNVNYYLKDPSRLAEVRPLLSANENYILETQGLKYLIKVMVDTRGRQETYLFFTRFIPKTIAWYFFIKGLVALVRSSIHDPAPNAEKVGVCSESDSYDKILLENDTMSGNALTPKPFDPMFIGPPEGGKFKGQHNPCDPDGSISDLYIKLLQENPNDPYLTKWYEDNSVMKKFNSTSTFGDPGQADVLIDKIRATYKNKNTGCCEYVHWYRSQPPK